MEQLNVEDDNNICYTFYEKNVNVSNNITYTEVLDNVNASIQNIPDEKTDELISMMVNEDLCQSEDMSFLLSNYMVQELSYNDNYTFKQLSYIAEYYDISRRKKKKAELIEDIVIFENDPTNQEISSRRYTLWNYMEEIKKDKYLSKFLILE